MAFEMHVAILIGEPNGGAWRLWELLSQRQLRPEKQ